ncbi:hypothetical protein IWX47DRAFT_147189 [Phyllosticta citricarpa]
MQHQKATPHPSQKTFSTHLPAPLRNAITHLPTARKASHARTNRLAMADDADGTVATNTPAPLPKDGILGLVNDSLGFLDRLFAEHQLFVLQANADTNGVRAFLGDHWFNSRIGQWLRYTESLVQRIGLLDRDVRVLSDLLDRAPYNSYQTDHGGYVVTMSFSPDTMSYLDGILRANPHEPMVVRSILMLKPGSRRDELVITPVESEEQEWRNRLQNSYRPVVQVVRDKSWQGWMDVGPGDDGSDDDDDNDDDEDEPGDSDGEINSKLDKYVKKTKRVLDYHKFNFAHLNNQEWKQHLNNLTRPEARDDQENSQFSLFQFACLHSYVTQIVNAKNEKITWLRGQVETARKSAKAIRNKSAIHSQQGQIKQQNQKVDELERQVRDLQKQLSDEKNKHESTKQELESCRSTMEDAGDKDNVQGIIQAQKKQSQRLAKLQDQTKKAAHKEKARNEKLKYDLDRQKIENSKLQEQLEAARATAADGSGATGDGLALAKAKADAKKATRDKNDAEARATAAENALSKAQEAAKAKDDQAATDAQALAAEKARADQAVQALADAQAVARTDADQAAQKLADAHAQADQARKDREAAQADAKTMADQADQDLKKCKSDLAEAQKKQKDGGNDDGDDGSGDEGQLLSTATLNANKAKELKNNVLSLALKGTMVPVEGSTSTGFISALGDSKGTGTAQFFKNGDGKRIVKVKARFEAEEPEEGGEDGEGEDNEKGDGDRRVTRKRAAKGPADGETGGKKPKTGKTS